MKDKPGYSWGTDCPFNLICSSQGWLVVNFGTTFPQIVARFPRGFLGKDNATKRGTILNYRSDKVDPKVLKEMDEMT